MDLRHPVRSLTWAMIRALEHDLKGVESPVANDLLTTQSPGSIEARPVEKDCSVVMFTQTWSVDDLGFTRQQSDRSAIDAETVVITGPCGDACVYVSTQLLYHVTAPNRRFFLDLAAQHMRAKAEASVYEGRDSSDEEAFDYEVAGALASCAVRYGAWPEVMPSASSGDCGTALQKWNRLVAHSAATVRHRTGFDLEDVRTLVCSTTAKAGFAQESEDEDVSNSEYRNLRTLWRVWGHVKPALAALLCRNEEQFSP